MKRKNVALKILVGLVLCLILREFGLIDASFYRSNLSSTRSQTTQSNRGQSNVGGKHFSFNLTIKHHNQKLDSLSHSYNSLPPLEIEATLEEPVYSGTTALPLVKNFTMTYQCKFTTLTSPNEQSVSGTIEGKVTAKIQGLCSRKKARELAFEEAKKQIITSFKSLEL